MSDIKQYRAKVMYHVKEETCIDGIYARSKEDAQAIAKIKFKNSFTDKCVFDSVEVLEFEP